MNRGGSEQKMMPKGVNQGVRPDAISPKPASCQFRVGPQFKLIGRKPVREPPLPLFDPTAAAGKCSNVILGQHLGGAFVELFCAPHLLETRQQVVRPQPPFLSPLKVVDNLATVHHDQAVP